MFSFTALKVQISLRVVESLLYFTITGEVFFTLLYEFCSYVHLLFQNSVLGVVLATQHFGNPLTAVPCAVSSVCHSIFGSTLAGIWRRSIPTDTVVTLPEQVEKDH